MPLPMMLFGVDRERYLAMERRHPFVKEGKAATLDALGPQLQSLYLKQEEAMRLSRVLWKKYLAACIANGIEPKTGAGSPPPPA